MPKILVAYATKYGSTAEIARAIGETLAKTGAEAEVVRAREVKDVRPYDLVVIGTPIFMGRPMKEAVTFAGKFRDALAGKKVALFSVGLMTKEDTAENRAKAREFLTPIAGITGAAEIATFAGKIDQSRFGFFMRILARMDKAGLFTEGDWRDWDAIRKWAESLV